MSRLGVVVFVLLCFGSGAGVGFGFLADNYSHFAQAGARFNKAIDAKDLPTAFSAHDEELRLTEQAIQITGFTSVCLIGCSSLLVYAILYAKTANSKPNASLKSRV